MSLLRGIVDDLKDKIMSALSFNAKLVTGSIGSNEEAYWEKAQFEWSSVVRLTSIALEEITLTSS